MDYPHRRYLLYLLSLKRSAREIQEDCVSKGLLPPNDESLAPLIREMGIPPAFWQPEFTKRSPVEFKKWLLDKDVYEMWLNEKPMQEAVTFLDMAHIRKAFETLMLVHNEVSECRTPLIDKYGKAHIPSLEGLELYCTYFWDTKSMTYRVLKDYLNASDGMAQQIQAFEGGIEDTYAQLGLRQTLDNAQELRTFLQLVHQQVASTLRMGGVMAGAQLIGLAAAQRAALDSMDRLDTLEARSGRGANTVKGQAAAFVARRITKVLDIPSYDELPKPEPERAVEGVIDVTDEERGPQAGDRQPDNVRHLPIRR